MTVSPMKGMNLQIQRKLLFVSGAHLTPTHPFRLFDIDSSDHVSKGSLHATEIPNRAGRQGGNRDDGQRKSRPIHVVLTAEQAPAESVDDADHRIDGIKETKPVRNNTAQKPDRRDVKAKLNNKWNNKAEITVLDHKSGDPQADSEGSCKRQEHKERQKRDGCRRHKAIPDHQHDKEDCGDQKINEAGYHTAGRDDEAGKIDLGN